MKYPTPCLALLMMAAPASGFTAILFQNSADLTANFNTGGVGVNSTISVVNGSTSPVSALDGDAIRFADASATLLPVLTYQSSVGLADALKVSFDVKIATISSNVVFRMGPTASTLGVIGNVTLGVQLTSTGTAAVDTSPATPNFTGSFSSANRVNITIFYNHSDATMNLTGLSGPAELAANQWALYVDGVLKSSALTERNVLDNSESFGFMWRSGTGAAATMDFQLDNIEYTNISAVPEPSSYAAIFGLGALGFAAAGRRRRTVTA